MRRDIFQAISDPVRREIITMLSHKDLSVHQIAAHFTISRPAISKHIKILKESNLIQIRKEGREHFCHLVSDQLLAAQIWMQQICNSPIEASLSFERYLLTLNKSD
jgi:DNA-binding transcriptional ArsR family regulator